MDTIHSCRRSSCPARKLKAELTAKGAARSAAIRRSDDPTDTLRYGDMDVCCVAGCLSTEITTLDACWPSQAVNSVCHQDWTQEDDSGRTSTSLQFIIITPPYLLRRSTLPLPADNAGATTNTTISPPHTHPTAH
jgi:hypothetical protein